MNKDQDVVNVKISDGGQALSIVPKNVVVGLGAVGT